MEYWTGGTEEQSVKVEHVFSKRIPATCIIQLEMNGDPAVTWRICVLILGLQGLVFAQQTKVFIIGNWRPFVER